MTPNGKISFPLQGRIISVRIYARPLKPQELKQNLIATKLVSNAG